MVPSYDCSYLFMCLFKENILSTFPQDTASQFAQVFVALDDSEKVVAGQLSNFTGETGTSIGKEYFGLSITAGVEQELAWCRMAGMVLEDADAEVALSQWYPASFAAP